MSRNRFIANRGPTSDSVAINHCSYGHWFPTKKV